MAAPTNTLKQRLAAGEVTYGCWLGLASAYTAELAGTAGFDWLLIDGEHAPNTIPTILAQLQALQGSASAPVVRLPDGSTTGIKQALDIGAQSLLIPMVESAAQAKDILRATRYPPEGMRGVGSALVRASKFSTVPDYLNTANREILLLVQVESVAGLQALDDILTVDGIDGVFIGPSDLAADMGYPGQPMAEPVASAVLQAITTIKAAGKAAGVLTTNPGFIADCRTAGATFIGVGIDVTILVAALAKTAADHKALPET